MLCLDTRMLPLTRKIRASAVCLRFHFTAFFPCVLLRIIIFFSTQVRLLLAFVRCLESHLTRLVSELNDKFAIYV